MNGLVPLPRQGAHRNCILDSWRVVLVFGSICEGTGDMCEDAPHRRIEEYERTQRHI